MRFDGGGGGGAWVEGGWGGRVGQGRGCQGGVRGRWYQATGKIQARELEIVKSVDLNSKNEQIALTERGVTFH